MCWVIGAPFCHCMNYSFLVVAPPSCSYLVSNSPRRDLSLCLLSNENILKGGWWITSVINAVFIMPSERWWQLIICLLDVCPYADFDAVLLWDRYILKREKVHQQSMADCKWVMEAESHRDRGIYCLGSEQSKGDTFSDSTKTQSKRRHLLSHLLFHLSLLSNWRELLV